MGVEAECQLGKVTTVVELATDFKRGSSSLSFLIVCNLERSAPVRKVCGFPLDRGRTVKPN